MFFKERHSHTHPIRGKKGVFATCCRISLWITELLTLNSSLLSFLSCKSLGRQTANSRPIEREVIATCLHRNHIERVFKSQAHKSGGLASITASLESKWLFTVVLPNCLYSPLLLSLVHWKATRNQHGRGGLSASQNNCWQLLGCLDIGERDRLYVEIQRVVSEWVCLNQWRLRWD